VFLILILWVLNLLPVKKAAPSEEKDTNLPESSFVCCVSGESSTTCLKNKESLNKITEGRHKFWAESGVLIHAVDDLSMDEVENRKADTRNHRTFNQKWEDFKKQMGLSDPFLI